MLSYIRTLESLDDSGRYAQILAWLTEANIDYEIHSYPSGRNIILPTTRSPKIGVGAHFDTVPGTPGANDNGSAIAVCLDLAKRQQQEPLTNIGLEICIFDEEETGLKGSTAYVDKVGVQDYLGFINMELVGMGNQFALWPLDATAAGQALRTFEAMAARQGVTTSRLDRIVMNSADHESFRRKGLGDSFTITCISDEDVAVAAQYYQAMQVTDDVNTLFGIFSQAPIFEHYHQPSDRSEYLSEAALQMTADAIWETLVRLDREG